MEISSEIIVGGIGLVSTIITGWTSWFFTRKKYNSEVNKVTIENMDDSLEFYKKLSDDNRARLKELMERNKALEERVQELSDKVLTLTMNICLDLTCSRRIREEKNKTKIVNGKIKNRFNETEDSSRRGSKSIGEE